MLCREAKTYRTDRRASWFGFISFWEYHAQLLHGLCEFGSETWIFALKKIFDFLIKNRFLRFFKLNIAKVKNSHASYTFFPSNKLTLHKVCVARTLQRHVALCIGGRAFRHA